MRRAGRSGRVDRRRRSQAAVPRTAASLRDEGVRGWRYRLREESFRGIAASLDAYLRSDAD
jgi:hypothetical protein